MDMSTTNDKTKNKVNYKREIQISFELINWGRIWTVPEREISMYKCGKRGGEPSRLRE